LVYLKSLVELIPEVEEKLNHQLDQLKNGGKAERRNVGMME
jgi:hypothetical protein